MQKWIIAKKSLTLKGALAFSTGVRIGAGIFA
jgi:hypothetical protein